MEIKAKSKIRKQGRSSLITTIPKTYVEILDWEVGNELQWIFNTETNTIELKIITEQDTNKKKKKRKYKKCQTIKAFFNI